MQTTMKTFIFYSPSNKEVIAIVANNSQEASILLIKEVENQIIKDDYYLATSCEHKYGAVAATINLDNSHLSDEDDEIDPEFVYLLQK